MRINVNRVNVLLSEQGMTKKELSNRCGVDRTYLSTILKRGNCSPISLGKISKALGVKPEEIFIEDMCT